MSKMLSIGQQWHVLHRHQLGKMQIEQAYGAMTLLVVKKSICNTYLNTDRFCTFLTHSYVRLIFIVTQMTLESSACALYCTFSPVIDFKLSIYVLGIRISFITSDTEEHEQTQTTAILDVSLNNNKVKILYITNLTWASAKTLNTDIYRKS